MAEKTGIDVPRLRSDPNAAKIIRLLTEARRGMPLSELTAKTGAEESAVRASISGLTESGLVEELIPGGSYTLGGAFFEVAYRVAGILAGGSTDFHYVQKLVDAAGETVHLVVLRDPLLEVAREISLSLRYRSVSGEN
jgi:DNA-binding IclR family transcriptional regulator